MLNKVYCYTSQFEYLFPIGGERATYHGSKLNNSLVKKRPGRSTRTRSARAPYKTADNLCATRSDAKKSDNVSLQEGFTVQEKGFMIAKTQQINKLKGQFQHFVSSSF